MTATATEAATVAGGGELQDADNTATTSQSFTVTVDPVRDSTLSVADTAVKEDLGQAADQIASVPSPTAGPQPLTINLSLGANEVATSITITGVPTGVAFNHGSAGPGNSWVLTPAELSGLQISAAPSDSARVRRSASGSTTISRPAALRANNAVNVPTTPCPNTITASPTRTPTRRG